MTAPGSNADFASRFFAQKLGVLSMVARRIADDLKNRHPERPAQFNIAEGLTAYWDGGLVTVAMEKMLSKALKLSIKAPCTVIEFGAVEKNGSRAFFVKDNGIGFDMPYANKLFNLFRGLHTAEKFPGSGRATVKRIVNRRGGQVLKKSNILNGLSLYENKCRL